MKDIRNLFKEIEDNLSRMKELLVKHRINCSSITVNSEDPYAEEMTISIWLEDDFLRSATKGIYLTIDELTSVLNERDILHRNF